MSIVLDAAYALTAAVTAPWWMRKTRGGWAERFGRMEPLPSAGRPRILLHAVSVGEVNLTRPLVGLLRRDMDVVLSATTDTGIARARAIYESGKCAGWARVVRYPLDASWSVRRFLDAVRPSGVALVELELWPNFVRECERRGIPVAVINGRLSARSFKRYRAARPWIGASFRRLAFAAVQDEVYAERFREMGVSPDRCHIAGSMKWDAAETSDVAFGSEQLATELGIDRTRPLIVAGSTAPGEHELLRKAIPSGAQLLCAPRKPEWFDQAAEALPGCVRRSTGGRGKSDLYLLDTIGELRKAYALADVVVVGRSFGKLYGSDPMEPAALAKPVLIGPSVSDFESIVRTMLRADAIVQTDAHGLAREIAALLADEPGRRTLGLRARQCVIANQGAAQRHARLLAEMLGIHEPGRRSA
jgi:3-deoxy-D-manno-octulosonic-acid transferase